MVKLPFFQFYPADWIQDTQHISLESSGAWIKILCQLHIAPERGKLTWTKQKWQQFLGHPEGDRALILLDELDGTADIVMIGIGDQRVFKWEETLIVTITSRRMVRDEAKQLQELDRKRRYEENHPTRRRQSSDVNPTDRRQTSDVRQREDKKTRNKSQPSSEGRRAAQTLSDKIFENYPDRTLPTEAVLMEWSREADRIYKIDSHGWEEILSLLEWSQMDPFWKTNILSMQKFRKQWNQLTAHKNRGGEHGQEKQTALESIAGYAKRQNIFDKK